MPVRARLKDQCKCENFPHEYSSRYVPFNGSSGEGFNPHTSLDRALTSYAQLAARRLGTDRAFISLFDSTYQYILAEATPTLSLVGGHVANNAEQLILGCCILPKERGLCHCIELTHHCRDHSEDTGDNDRSCVALDVMQNEHFDCAKLQDWLSEIRFFMAVPIISEQGVNIGALSLMDSKPRSFGPDLNARQFMRDMAAVLMEHLAMERVESPSRMEDLQQRRI